MADAACKLARRRINAHFKAVFRNDDTDIYKVARGAMADRYAWLEEGIAAEGAASGAETGTAGATPAADDPAPAGAATSPAKEPVPA